MKYLSCDKAGFMSLSCESMCVTYETSKRDSYVSYIWRCTNNNVGSWQFKEVNKIEKSEWRKEAKDDSESKVNNREARVATNLESSKPRITAEY
jgi:hypothetical protein